MLGKIRFFLLHVRSAHCVEYSCTDIVTWLRDFELFFTLNINGSIIIILLFLDHKLTTMAREQKTQM